MLLAGTGSAWAGGVVCPEPTGSTFTVDTVADTACPDFGGSEQTSCAISLRCAIELANGVAIGRATILFDIDGCDASGNVCVITVDSELPALTHETTIDGKSQEVHGINPQHPGLLGDAADDDGVLAVGVMPAVLANAIDGPEIEITRGAGVIPNGLVVQAPRVIIKGLAIWGFGDKPAPADPFDVGANLELSPGPADVSLTLEDSVIGATATGAVPPADAAADDVVNVHIESGAGATIHGSYIANGSIGVAIDDSVLNLIERSEIDGNRQWGIALNGAATTQVKVFENLITDNGYAGFDAGALDALTASGGTHVLRSNTIVNNGTAGGADVEGLFASTPGVQLWGIDNTVERNLIQGNFGAGVQVTVNSEDNEITHNVIRGNGTVGAEPSGQIGIDLHTAAGDEATGTPPYVTANGAGDTRTDFPVFTRANLVKNGATTNLELVGTTVNGARVEVYIADDDLPMRPGQGDRFVGELTEPTSDPDGDFSVTFPNVSVPRGIIIVATAFANNETSEFSANTTTTSFADMAIAVTDAPEPVGVSDTLTYTVVVTNGGSSESPTQSVSITPDAALGSPSLGARGDGWTCVAGTPIVCTRNAVLASGAMTMFSFTATAPAAPQDLSSTFTVVSENSDDPVPANDSATVVTTVTRATHIRVAIGAAPNPVNIDDDLTYTVTVTNPPFDEGTTARATGVVVDVTIPDGRPGSVVTPPAGWTCNPNAPPAEPIVRCTTPEVLVGSTHVITVSSVAPHLAGNYDVGALIDADGADDFDASVTLVVGAVTDLALRIIDTPDPAATGAAVTYTIVLTNLGPDRANGGLVTVTLPPNGDFDTTSAACELVDSETVVCEPTVLESGLSQSFTVTVFAPDAPGNMVLSGVASPGMLNDDTNLANNEAQAITVVTDKADLALSLTAPSSVTTGAQFTSLLTIANLGVKDATNVAATYMLPAGSTFVSATATEWSCSNSGTTVTCTRALLASLDSSLIRVVALAPSATGSVTASALVESDAAEDSTSNNSDVATIDVVSPLGTADVSVTLAGAPDPVDLGGTITYTVGAANAGPDAAGSTSVSVQLAAGVTFVSAEGPGFTCGAEGQVVTCTSASLAAGGSSTITVTTTAPSTAGTVNASASISSSAEDPSSANNVATTTTVVAALADLSADISGPATARGGTAIVYTATVTNAGPRAASGVQAVITVGAGATLGTVTAADWTCTSAALVVTCTRDGLATGASTITVNATAPTDGGTLTTTLAVASTSNDTVPGNDTDSVTTAVTGGNACTMDSDCGNTTSGKVCEGLVCVNGCRGMGGNGCPAGQMCTSTTTGVGSCVPVNVPDAGPVDAGVDARPDAAAADAGAADARLDAGAPDAARPDASIEEGSLEGSGCSCTTARDADLPLGSLLIAAFALLVVRRRR